MVNVPTEPREFLPVVERVLEEINAAGPRAAASLSQMTKAGCASRFVKLIGTSTFIGIWTLVIRFAADR